MEGGGDEGFSAENQRHVSRLQTVVVSMFERRCLINRPSTQLTDRLHSSLIGVVDNRRAAGSVFSDNHKAAGSMRISKISLARERL